MRNLRSRTASSGTAWVPTRHIIDAELAKGRFGFIYQDSFQKEIPVKNCFPITGIKKICESAISGLMKDFSVDEEGVIGYSAAGGLKVVVKIPENELGLVRDYFLSIGERIADATAKAFNEGIEWYGIVDGAHVHAALMKLKDYRPDTYSDFSWMVTVISWNHIDTLRAFGRARNLLQSKHVVEMTLFDTINALHEIAKKRTVSSGTSFEELSRRRGTVTEIADEFCGGTKYSKQTTRTLTGAALRIKPAAVQTMGIIMNESDLEMCRKILDRNGEASPLGYISDDRPYRQFISTNTIRAATSFLNATEFDQSNALKRLRSAFEENGFKPFQASRLNKETERCEKARHQISLMNDLMGRDCWPPPMMEIQNKLLISSVFNSELDESDIKKDDILPGLVAMYRLKMPLEAGIRCSLYRRERNATSTPSSTQNGSGPPCPNTTENCEGSLSCESERVDNTAAEGQEFSPCVSPLEDLDIACHNLTLEDFSVNRDPKDEKFHLVVGDPSELQLNGTCKKPINEQQADKIMGMLKSLVHPHGWVFFYTRPVDFHIWDKVFKANDFDPLQFAWPMIRDCDKIQTNTSSIPQNITELMIGGRKKHPGRPDFLPDILSNYERNVSSRKKKFAVLDCCPEPTLKLKKRNTREPVRKNERSPEPIAEFVKTFCPEHGNVLDAFAGTMETAKACFLVSRKCTALEADRMCYDLSIERLKESAAAYLLYMGTTDNLRDETTENRSSDAEDVDPHGSSDDDNNQFTQEDGTVCDESPSVSEAENERDQEDEEEQGK